VGCKKLREEALLRRIEVRDQQEGEATARWHEAEETFEHGQPARRGAKGNRSRAARGFGPWTLALLVVRRRGVRCPVSRGLRAAFPLSASLPRAAGFRLGACHGASNVPNGVEESAAVCPRGSCAHRVVELRWVGAARREAAHADDHDCAVGARP
jgi:hypothetical protein